MGRGHTVDPGEEQVVRRLLVRWYLLPGMFWLVVVTATGTLIRFLWAYPGLLAVDAKHLTHAHSHVALLGWAWSVATAYLLKFHMSGWLQRRLVVKGYAILLHVCTAGMLVTFSMGGYWKGSILFSAAHVVLGLAFSAAYAHQRRMSAPKPSSMAFDAAVLFGVVANLAPLALALGSRVGTAGVTIIVNGYVHLQCFGFLGFFLVGMACDSVLRRPMLRDPRRLRTAVAAMVLGVVPAQLVAVSHLVPGDMDIWLGSAGMAAYAAGLWFLVRELVARRKVMRRAGCFRAVSVAVGGAAVLASILTLASVPPVSALFIGARFMVVGVIHLLLLGMLTPVFLLYVHREAGVRLRQIRVPVAVFVASVWAMLVLLLLGGFAQGLQMTLPFNIAKGLLHVAVPVMLAAGWLWAAGIRAAARRPGKTEGLRLKISER